MTDTIKVLMILTSHASIGEGGEPTGVWFEELTTPYYTFTDAGVEVDIASIKGGEIPIDPRSLTVEGENPASVDRFLKDDAAIQNIKASISIDTISPSRYQAIFLPGGHGTMWDMPNSNTLASLLSLAWGEGKVLAAVCHGPSGLVNVKDQQGQPLVAGRRVTAFTNTEEAAVGLTDVVPFLLESRIKELGAHYENAPDFEAFAVRDGRLVTGQNPASSEKAAQLTLEAIDETKND